MIGIVEDISREVCLHIGTSDSTRYQFTSVDLQGGFLVKFIYT